MGLDVSDAVALAKDLMKSSHDYRQHDPSLSAAFAEQAFEICNDLGLDRSLIEMPGHQASSVDITPSVLSAHAVSAEATDETAKPLAIGEDEPEETSLQLRNLLRQQAQVMKNIQEPESIVESQKPKRKSPFRFKLFGRSTDQGMAALQSA